MLDSLPDDVLLHVVSFLDHREDCAALAACNTHLAGLARDSWHDWFGTHPELVLDKAIFSEDTFKSMLAALKDRTLPDTTELELDMRRGGRGDTIDHLGMALYILLDAMTKRMPNLETMNLHGITPAPRLNCNHLIHAMRHAKNLRELTFDVHPGDVSGPQTWKFDMLSGLECLNIFMNPDDHDGWYVDIRLPSSLTGLYLADFNNVFNWNINEILPAGLRELHLATTYLSDIDYSRLKNLDTLVAETSIVNMDDLPDSLTTLHLLFEPGERDYEVREDGGGQAHLTIRLAHLTRLKDLRIENLSRESSEGVQMQSLSRLTNLTSLSLENFGCMDTAVLASSFPRLTYLSLDVFPDLDKDPIPPLPHAPLLSELRLSLACVSDDFSDDGGYGTVPLRLGPSPPALEPALEPALDLSRYPRLHTLTLRRAELDTAAAEHLLSLPALCTLTLRACKIDPTALELLSGDDVPFYVTIVDKEREPW